jgi:hypothetical protein
MPFVGGSQYLAAILPVALCGAIGCGEFAPAAADRMMAPEPCVPRMLVATAGTGTQKTGDADEKTKTRKRTVVWSALYLVAGIALLGVLLIVVIVLWGIRLRQRNRTRKSPEATFDPLWYLRKGSTGTSEPPPPEDGPKPDGT